MAVLVAERTGHAAAARVELLHLDTRNPLQGRHGPFRPEDRLLLAVSMEEYAPGKGIQAKFGDAIAVGDERLDEPGGLRHLVGRRAQAEVAVLVDERDQAARLAAEDRQPLAHQGMEPLDVL